MKDYNLRNRDIYGEPRRGGGRRWLAGLITLAVLAAAAAAVVFITERQATPKSTPAHATTPDIIPLAIPPRATGDKS